MRNTMPQPTESPNNLAGHDPLPPPNARAHRVASICFAATAVIMLALFFIARGWSHGPYAGMFLALAVIAFVRSIWHLIRSRMLKP